MIAQLPSEKRPIYIIGAGGIVNDAHLPAYKIAGYNVQGIFDINEAKAKKTAETFSIPNTFSSLTQMLQAAPDNAVFDVAVPGSQTIPVLQQLPMTQKYYCKNQWVKIMQKQNKYSNWLGIKKCWWQ